MPDALSFLLILFLALIVIGPNRLPAALEALWLALGDYNRIQRGIPPLENLENARRYWVSTNDRFYAIVRMIYRVTEHLEELRRRLLISTVALAIGFLVALIFAQPLLGLLISPINRFPIAPSQAPVNTYVLAKDVTVTVPTISAWGTVSTTVTIPRGTELPLTLPSPKPVFLRPTEIFLNYFKVAGVVALGLALPILVWQLLLFLRGPDYSGLTRAEMRPIYFLTPLAGLFFLSGLAFTYVVILPNALAFLFGLGGELVQAMPALDDYIGFALTLMVWIGLAFETPLIMFFLARLKIVSAKKYVQYWRYAIVLIAVIAAVITPTTDPFNMALVAGPMVLLYVMGIVLARFA
jgi:sec-independent protein translocase protein TatC